MYLIFATSLTILSFAFQLSTFIINHNKDINREYISLANLNDPLTSAEIDRIVDFMDMVQFAIKLKILRRQSLWIERMKRLQMILDQSQIYLASNYDYQLQSVMIKP